MIFCLFTVLGWTLGGALYLSYKLCRWCSVFALRILWAVPNNAMWLILWCVIVMAAHRYAPLKHP